jgi:hypothetical protein
MCVKIPYLGKVKSLKNVGSVVGHLEDVVLLGLVMRRNAKRELGGVKGYTNQFIVGLSEKFCTWLSRSG